MKRIFQYSMPFFIALISFILLLTGSIVLSNYKLNLWEKNSKARLYELMMTKISKLEMALYSRIYYTKSLAAYVSLNPEISNEEFQNLASELVNKDSVICSMGLSKDYIIQAIYPLKGNEKAIGMDLMAHPDRRAMLEQTIKTRKTYISDPVLLAEGRLAFISYTPIFDKTSTGKDKFWGVTEIVIDKKLLLEEATIQQKESGFLFALRSDDSREVESGVWFGDNNIFEQDPLIATLELPNGKWKLAAIPEYGWTSYVKHDQIFLTLLISSSFLISVLIWIIGKAIAKIRRNEKELNAIFHSMNSLIIEFDRDGRYIKIPPINSALLIKPKEELLNKTLYEELPKSEARKSHEAILACLESRKLVEFEYNLLVDNKKKWFAARVSWKSENRVIFHAFDITEQKNAREEIIKTGNRLKELNATKVKLFSIIAHDLKSPFNVILGYSDLLKSSYDDIEESERKKIIEELEKSSKTVYKLLENLLLWARSQSRKIKIKKEDVNLKALVMEAINAYVIVAKKKNIQIDIDVPDDIIIHADKFAIRTVIANLFDNAIKYAPKDGDVRIEAVRTTSFIEVRISDNGQGIPPEIKPKLFQIEEHISTLGTDNEKGTGLGLILCKEFVEKHKGTIGILNGSDESESHWARNKKQHSDKYKGATFYFKLPN